MTAMFLQTWPKIKKTALIKLSHLRFTVLSCLYQYQGRQLAATKFQIGTLLFDFRFTLPLTLFLNYTCSALYILHMGSAKSDL